MVNFDFRSMDFATYDSLGRTIRWAEDELDDGVDARYVLDHVLGRLKRLRVEMDGSTRDSGTPGATS